MPAPDYSTTALGTLVSMYNDAAFELQRPMINRFADRKTAERRTAAIREELKGQRVEKDTHRDYPREADGVKTVGLIEITPNPTMAAAVIAAEQSLGHHGPKDRDKGVLNEAVKDAIAEQSDKTPPAAQPERWRQPKKWPAGKTAYRPRPGSLQAEAYALLTQPGGILVEAFSDAMKAKCKPGVKNWDLTVLWSNITYTLCSGHGYGAEFDGARVWLIVPRDERDPVHKGLSPAQKMAAAKALADLAKKEGV